MAKDGRAQYLQRQAILKLGVSKGCTCGLCVYVVQGDKATLEGRAKNPNPIPPPATFNRKMVPQLEVWRANGSTIYEAERQARDAILSALPLVSLLL